MVTQLKLPDIDDFFLSERLAESRAVVKEIAQRSEMPLIIQFSGGRDSMAMLGLVREVTEDFVCAYMATGTEFNGVIRSVKQTCEQLGVRLLISFPRQHKGNIFQRIEQFRSFPNLGSFEGGGKRLWCCRDLKLRPQKKMLAQVFGKGTFYKLEGIRLSESSRRKIIYKEYRGNPIRVDDEHRSSFEVFPIINWTDDDVLNYLAASGYKPLEKLYKDFGVSGCAWCPFYGPEIYSRVLERFPRQYDRFIEWEKRLNIPSVMGGVFLRDIKAAVLAGEVFVPPVQVKSERSPCMMEFEGKMVPTCDIYGHCYVDGRCFRCEEPEK